MDEDTEFLLQRASEEALLAITSENDEASEAHQGMSIRYSAKAIAQLANDDQDIGTPTSEGVNAGRPLTEADRAAF